MPVCDYCGAETSANQKFCQNCGNPMQSMHVEAGRNGASGHFRNYGRELTADELPALVSPIGCMVLFWLYATVCHSAGRLYSAPYFCAGRSIER